MHRTLRVVGPGRPTVAAILFLALAAIAARSLAASPCGQVAPPPGDQPSPVKPIAPPPAAEPPPPKSVPLQDGYPDEPRIEVARRLLAAGKYPEAKMVLDTILKQRPEIGRARFFLGVTLVKLKQYEMGRAELERSVQMAQPFPERKHAGHFEGWASYHLGELARAKSDFEAHLIAVPDEPDSTFGLGLIAFDEDRLDDAEAFFRKAIDLQQGPTASKRDVSKAWARLGDVSMRRDRPEEAEERFMTALALYANHYEAWAKLARARDRLGKTKEADIAREEEIKAMERVGKGKLERDDAHATPPGTPIAPPRPDGAQSPPASPPVSPPAPPSPELQRQLQQPR